MALKFLNKKGWHTGSLRNIENVWKAEQKHDAEQKKLEELRKQIMEERERSEFRLLQEQAGLVPKQERLDFLYDSGLAVGKGGGSSSSKAAEGVVFKALEESTPATNNSSGNNKAASAVPGALFEDKPHSANDAWRKLHTDPLLLIRQREQDALARIKNNPVQMSLIRKSIGASKEKEKSRDKEHRKKHKHSKEKRPKHLLAKQESDSDDNSNEHRRRKDSSRSSKRPSDSFDDSYEHRRRKDSYKSSRQSDSDENSNEHRRRKDSYRSSKQQSDSDDNANEHRRRKDSYRSSKHRDLYAIEKSAKDERQNNHDKPSSDKTKFDSNTRDREARSFKEARSHDSSAMPVRHDTHNKRRNTAPKLSEEERAARLKEMQADAELHEEQRYKRLKKAEKADAQEAALANTTSGRNFLDATRKSVYGAEKGGSSTIEESVRRRTFTSQRSEGEGNAFRR